MGLTPLLLLTQLLFLAPWASLTLWPILLATMTWARCLPTPTSTEWLMNSPEPGSTSRSLMMELAREGHYSVNLPDGRIQHVNYHADDITGFVSEVTYDGVAAVPAVAVGHSVVGNGVVGHGVAH